MIVAIASGKGGTGKTTVAVSLAQVARGPVRLLDCDVEEPNCHLFLRPEIERIEPVTMPIPKVDEARCTACGECGRFCEFNAIVSFKTTPLVFPELCHGCGGCLDVCPEGAIREVAREIGVVELGHAGNVVFAHGRLSVGEPMAPPVIRRVKRHARGDGLTIVDSPPGTSCPVIESVRGADFIALVTEPTPFGLFDLTLAAGVVRQLRIPFGVVINRVGIGDERVREYCRSERIPVLVEIADDRRIAEAYSRGEIIVGAVPEMRSTFEELLERIAQSRGAAAETSVQGR